MHAPLIMIVDDLRDNAYVQAELLGVLGYRTVIALNQQEALEKSAVQRPDVFFLDIRYDHPFEDGYDLGAHLKKICPSATFVALTGSTRNTQRELESGFVFDHFLVKPAALDQLLRILPPATA